MAPNLTLALTILVIASSGGDSTPSDSGFSVSFPMTIRFDESRHECYLHGKKVSSPLILGYDAELDGLTANGVDLKHPSKTAEYREEVARQAFSQVPFVVRRASKELSFRAAGRMYVAAMDTNLTQAIFAYRDARAHGENGEEAARASLDTEIVDVSKPIVVGPSQIRVRLRDLGIQYAFMLGDTARIFQSANTESIALKTAVEVRHGLSLTDRTLVIASESTVVVFQGDEDIRGARKEISRALGQWPREAPRVPGKIPDSMMEEIVKANGGPRAPSH